MSTLEQGLQLVRSGELKDALKLFEQGEHWVEAARVAARLKKTSKAIEYFVRAGNLGEAANIYLSDGDFLKAAEYFAQASLYLEAGTALEQHLAKKFGVNKTNASTKEINRDARAVVKDLVQYHTKANSFDTAATWLYALGDKLKAAELFSKGNGHGKAAAIFEEFGKHYEAGQAWGRAADYHRSGEAYKKGEHYVEAGQAFELANAYDAAVTCYRRGKKLNLAADYCLRQNRQQEAAELYVEGKHYFDAAGCFRKLQNHEQVIENVLKMSKQDPNYNKGCLILIDASIKRAEINFQTDDFIKEFLLNPFTPKTLKLFYDFAQLYEKLEFFESAQQIYEGIVAVDANYESVQQRLEFVRLQITGSPMAVRKILEDDFGYKQTSERLAGYQNKSRPGQVPVSAAPASPGVESNNPYTTSNFGGTPQISGMGAAAPAASGSVPALDFTPGMVLFGRYKVLERLGSGSSSVVCRVRDQEIDDELALKILDSASTLGAGLEQFKKEIKIARKIQHPNVVSIYDYGKHGGNHFITLESVDGRTLQETIEREGRFSIEKGAAILAQICDGLEAIHEQGIVHRDLKPQNIKLTKDGKVKILDFGLATGTDYSGGVAAEEGVVVGTVAYMSPEQIQGKPLDKRSDLYSLGIIMYEMFTEQHPFDGKELKTLVYQQLKEQPTPPVSINSGIPEKLQTAILKCMAKSADERYASCGDLLQLVCEVGGIKRGGAAAVERPKIVNERYEIKGEIGRGGMGVVYRAFDQSLHRDVALKFLPHELSASKEDLDVFLNEARAAARLNHNNIVTIFNIEKQDKEYFIVMEYIDGENIHNLLETMEKLPFKSVELICRQVCDALDYAHKRKIYHRDIKSANLLWTNDKLIKITDFGLAKIAEGALAASTRVQGSPAYMSPEQITGKNVDHRTDLYSLGVALYEMTTGFVPFSKGDIAYHQLHTEPTPVEEFRPETPEHLRQIIARCMRKKPEERFQTASEIVALLPKS